EPGGQEAGQLLPPQVGDGEVDADPPQPGTGRGGRGVAEAGTVGADEGLLGQVLGRGGVQDDGADGAVDRGVLLVVELAELCCGVELPALGHGISLMAEAPSPDSFDTRPRLTRSRGR